MWTELTEPTLILDESRCRKNLERMASKARRLGLRFRPHCKTHQSKEVGRWLRDYGVKAITVSSLRMAEYFADDGWRDITVAFPVNPREWERIRSLHRRIALNLVAENTDSLQVVGRIAEKPIAVYIKADTGYHRTGLGLGETERIDALLDYLDRQPLLQFAGFLAHAGHSYAARQFSAIASVHHDSLGQMRQLKERYRSRYPDLIASIGDTPTCSAMEDFPGIDEIRPGNFVFYDVTQSRIGACQLEEVAVALACPVVAKHPQRNEIVLYGGGIHFSKDRVDWRDGQTIYGIVVEWTPESWRVPENPAYLRSLSQEHGIVKATPELLARTQVGDLLGVLPVHSCMCADLMKGYRTLSGSKLEMMVVGNW